MVTDEGEHGSCSASRKKFSTNVSDGDYSTPRQRRLQLFQCLLVRATRRRSARNLMMSHRVLRCRTVARGDCLVLCELHANRGAQLQCVIEYRTAFVPRRNASVEGSSGICPCAYHSQKLARSLLWPAASDVRPLGIKQPVVGDLAARNIGRHAREISQDEVLAEDRRGRGRWARTVWFGHRLLDLGLHRVELHGTIEIVEQDESAAPDEFPAGSPLPAGSAPSRPVPRCTRTDSRRPHRCRVPRCGRTPVRRQSGWPA